MACSTSTRVRFRWPGFLGAAAIVAIATSVVACSSDSPATPRIYLTSTLSPGNESGVNDGTKCLVTGPWLAAGAKDQNNAVTPVNSGDNGVTVTCTVAQEGDGFKVSANITQNGQGGLTVQGHFTASGQQSHIRAVFARSDTGAFQEDDCTADYAPNPLMGIAAGRVWGTLACPHETNDESSPPHVCNGIAEFRFENCSQ